MSTAKGNCRRHVQSLHSDIYDKMVIENGWPYALSTEVDGAQPTVMDMRWHTLPQFSPQAFLNYLVWFIVADDQVHVIFLS